MLPCSVCSTPTLLLVKGIPFCLKCDEEREMRKRPKSIETEDSQRAEWQRLSSERTA